jgi:hypothetical protein
MRGRVSGSGDEPVRSTVSTSAIIMCEGNDSQDPGLMYVAVQEGPSNAWCYLSYFTLRRRVKLGGASALRGTSDIT